MTARVCPVSISQKRFGQPNGANLAAVTPAVNLPSLIAAVNQMRNILQTLSASLPINNTFGPGGVGGGGGLGGNGTSNSSSPLFKSKGNTFYSAYPAWNQINCQTSTDFVYHHDKAGWDRSQRSKVQRINSITYQNINQTDPDFIWYYNLPFGVIPQ